MLEITISWVPDQTPGRDKSKYIIYASPIRLAERQGRSVADEDFATSRERKLRQPAMQDRSVFASKSSSYNLQSQ
jgi:hypothetical protein